MRKMLLLLALIGSLCTTSVFAESWYWVGSNEYVTMYIDNDYVNKFDDFAQVYVKLAYPDGHYYIGQATIMYSTATMQIPEVSLYNANGQYQSTGVIPDLLYIQAVPGTLWRSLLNLCY